MGPDHVVKENGFIVSFDEGNTRGSEGVFLRKDESGSTLLPVGHRRLGNPNRQRTGCAFVSTCVAGTSSWTGSARVRGEGRSTRVDLISETWRSQAHRSSSGVVPLSGTRP